MAWIAIKVLLSALLIVAVSELARRSSLLAALLASLPLTSVLAMVWMHVEGSPAREIAGLSGQVFWLVLPSLLLFVLLPALLRQGWGFWWSLGASCAATAGAYLAMIALLRRLGITP